MLSIESLHHVSLVVSDLGRARRFYTGVLGLSELPRPRFAFAGAWYAIGDRQLHLIVPEALHQTGALPGTKSPTFRTGKPVDSRDVHFAIRVASYREAVEHLRECGYHPDAEDEVLRTRESARPTAGFPQVFVLDPDRNVIEINAGHLD